MTKFQKEHLTDTISHLKRTINSLQDRIEKCGQEGDLKAKADMELRLEKKSSELKGITDTLFALGYVVSWKYEEDGDKDIPDIITAKEAKEIAG